jgi:hypothetical protein
VTQAVHDMAYLTVSDRGSTTVSIRKWRDGRVLRWYPQAGQRVT